MARTGYRFLSRRALSVRPCRQLEAPSAAAGEGVSGLVSCLISSLHIWSAIPFIPSPSTSSWQAASRGPSTPFTLSSSKGSG
jgi:hypothetical protein